MSLSQTQARCSARVSNAHKRSYNSEGVHLTYEIKMGAAGAGSDHVRLLAACGGSNESKKESSDSSGGSKASASAGEELYQQSCIGCHGKDLEGGGGPNLQEVGGKYDEAKIESIIKNGRGNMPSHLVSDEDATKIAKWLSQKK